MRDTQRRRRCQGQEGFHDIKSGWGKGGGVGGGERGGEWNNVLFGMF